MEKADLEQLRRLKLKTHNKNILNKCNFLFRICEMEAHIKFGGGACFLLLNS